VNRYLFILAALGCAGAAPKVPTPPTPADITRGDRMALAAKSPSRSELRPVRPQMVINPLAGGSGAAIVAIVVRPGGIPDTASRTVLFVEGDSTAAWMACQTIMSSTYTPAPAESTGAIAIYWLKLDGQPAWSSKVRMSDEARRTLGDRVRAEEKAIHAGFDSLSHEKVREWIAAKPGCEAVRRPVAPPRARGRGSLVRAVR
jgi:hypothetical protein